MTQAAYAERPVRLGLAGDVMLGRQVNESLRDQSWERPWGDLLPDLSALDAFLVNLECALTRRVEKWRNAYYRPFHFRADPAVVRSLRAGRVNFASLANNHIGDFGLEGLLETVQVLDDAGIAHAGAGRDLGAARHPAILTIHGMRVAVLAFADYPDTWAATATTPGLNFTHISVAEQDFAPIAEAVQTARQQSDLVVLSIHWGPNMREHPPEEFRHFAHRVVDAGASIFWGHSAHILQGIEFRNDAVILYDTGDFVDDYAVDRDLRNDLGALFVVEATRSRVQRLTLMPVHIDHLQVNHAAEAERTWVVRRMEALCADFGSVVEDLGAGGIRIAPARHVVPAAIPA